MNKLLVIRGEIYFHNQNVADIRSIYDMRMVKESDIDDYLDQDIGYDWVIPSEFKGEIIYTNY